MSPERPEPPHRGARYWRVPPRRRLWVAVVGWTVWGLIGLAAAVLGGAYLYLDDTLEAAVPDTPTARAARAATTPALPGKPTNILLMGSDTRPSEGDPGRSDSLILVRMDPDRDLISMLSFPRDLWVDVPGYGQRKINEAYTYGPQVTIDTVEQLTGQPVNDYVIVDFAGFAKLVDRVGGVYLDIDRRYFNENVGTAATNYANIDIQPGYQKLDGENALSYVRYRHTDSTYARDARQQLFLSELKRQGAGLGSLTNVTSLRRIFDDGTIEMSIEDPGRFIRLMNLALFVPEDRVARASVEGRGDMVNGASVEIADPAEIAAKVALWMEPEFEQEAEVKPVDPRTVDVTVQNGSGRLLAAEDLAQALSDKKYNVRVGGNAGTFDYATSAVYYADGYRDAARRIAPLLGPDATVGALDNGNGGGDVVVVAGADFTGELRTPPKPEERPPASTTDTTSLVAPLRAIRSQVPGLRVMAPLKVAAGSEVRIVRAYRISKDGGDDGPPAVKLVMRTYVGGTARYWGISMTTMKDPPIVESDTRYTSGGREYRTFYDGRNLQRIAFKVGGTWYWVSNTLQNDLTAKTIEEIAKSMRPLNRARLPKGRTDTPITVSTEESTP